MDGWISAAFDTISHSILLDRLEEIGITDKALDLLKHVLKIEHIFLIYLRPLSILISKFPQIKFNIFADDIIIYQTLPPNNNDNSYLINYTNNIRNWLINNNLLLNIDHIQITKNLRQNEFPI